MKAIIFLFSLVFSVSILFAQQTAVAVTDSLPAMQDGLKAGYTIAETSEKEVGSKGTFSRYKIKFFVTNTASEAKILVQKPGLVLFNSSSISPNVVEFRCSNATGARFTNKTAALQMPSCKIEATVEDKECGSEKVVRNRRLVDIGYWIKPGETISVSSIMITPLGEKPNMTVAFFPYSSGGVVGTPLTGGNTTINNNEEFVKIKNFASNQYLNNQNGPLKCSEIDMGWWSAQWVIVPVNGTTNFQIRNRWKNNFISTETASMLSDNGQNTHAIWTIEETSTGNVFYIKNVADNLKLLYENGVLKTSNSYNTNDAKAQWVIAK